MTRDRHKRILDYEMTKLDAPAGPPSWEQVRDVPASCICTWELGLGPGPGQAWKRIKAIPGCPWHNPPGPVTIEVIWP